MGLAVASAMNGDDFRDANPDFDRSETAIELTWFTRISERFSIQPDIQYILNPGEEPGAKDAVQIGFRSVYSF